MNKIKHGIKRKNRQQQQVPNAKKEAKHLSFGQSDKKGTLEDKLAKPVFDERTSDSEQHEQDQDCYEQLLNVFGKNKDKQVESDFESDECLDEENVPVKETKSIVDFNKSIISEDDTSLQPMDSIEEEEEDEDINESTVGDNFAKHFFTNFQSQDIELLSKSVKNKRVFNWPHMGSFIEMKSEEEKFNLVQLNNPAKSIDHLQIKPLLKENVAKTMLQQSNNLQNSLTSFQLELLSVFTSYKDFFYPETNFEKNSEIRLSYCLHALNHVLKTRSRILSHNSKLKLLQIEKDEYRDQGLTRPKVLILLPFRESAYRTVNCMINLLFADARDTGDRKINIMNYKRFEREFGSSEFVGQLSDRKPDDYKQLFAGNIDDSFRIGLSLTKKSLKLYTEFYSSDIIIASPLGLRTVVGADGEEVRDFDFLSSIEMVILDQANVFLMQNWEHVLHIMNSLHLRPKQNHGADFSRVKLWVLELWSRYYYQLLVFSSVSTSLLNGFFNRFSNNYSGKVMMRNQVAAAKAAINHVYIQCPQILHRIKCDNFSQLSDIRFNFFINKILPKFKEKLMVRTLIYVPSYFDYVRLRNYFRKEELSFVQICEYTPEGKVAKARHIFFYGGRHFMLMTERFHFFHRYTIKGIRHLIFYEPPTYPHFYSEIVNSMHLSNQGKKLATDYSSMSVTVLFTKYDAHSLVTLAGSKIATDVLNSSSDVHMFTTEKTLS